MAKLTDKQELLAKMAATIFAGCYGGGGLNEPQAPQVAVEKAKEILAAIEKEYKQ